jgi:hypothetical protein
MIETLTHKEAFEYYYLLGNKRNSSSVATQFKVSERSVAKWSINFNWQERIQQRDIEIGKKLSEKTDETIVDQKANFVAEIKIQIGILKAILNKVTKGIKDGTFDIAIDNTSELKDVINSYEKLCRLYLLVVGEATEKVDIGLDIEDYKMIKSMSEKEREEYITKLQKICGSGNNTPINGDQGKDKE